MNAMMRLVSGAAVVCALSLASAAAGQSLLEEPTNRPAPPPTSPQEGGGEKDAAMRSGETFASFSLFAVTVPRPHKYGLHDLVQVIVNESSIQQFDQTLNANKKVDWKAELSQFPDLHDLIANLSLYNGIGAVKPGLGITSDNKFTSDGKYSRKDQVTAKLQATVIDVKPNGNLVLECKKSVGSDKEISTFVLSGTCRSEDLTKNNTVLSDQLADLVIKVDHEGLVKENADKGIITRVLEAIFNF